MNGLRGLSSCFALWAMTACGSAPADSAPTPDAWVEIRGVRVAVEEVITAAEQARGLGHRDSLAWDTGMLFLYDDAQFRGFWMKGMRFDIDIVWILRGRIADISHRVPSVESPEGPWPSYRPNSLVDQVLEVPAGYASSHGWQVGDRIEISRPARP